MQPCYHTVSDSFQGASSETHRALLPLAAALPLYAPLALPRFGYSRLGGKLPTGMAGQVAGAWKPRKVRGSGTREQGLVYYKNDYRV